MSAKTILYLLALLLCLFSPPQSKPSDLPESGYWMDSWSRRAHMDLTYEKDTCTAVIHWAVSAFEHVEWRMTGTFIGGVLQADDCTKTLHTYDENGAETVEILYENQPAALTYTGGVITWQDVEEMGSECRFELLPDMQ